MGRRVGSVLTLWVDEGLKRFVGIGKALGRYWVMLSRRRVGIEPKIHYAICLLLSCILRVW